jgi:tetratricopeptide (TPR) repeat protein
MKSSLILISLRRPVLFALPLVVTMLAGCSTLSTLGTSDRSAQAVERPAAEGSDEDVDTWAPNRPTAAVPQPEPDGPLPPLELSREIVFQVVAAEVAVQRGQIGPAVTTYIALAQSTGDPRMARRATELALADRSLDRALSAAQLWYKLAPTSPTAVQTIEALWLATDSFGDAEPLLAARLAKSREDGSLASTYQQLQRTLARASDKQKALAMLERLSQPDDKVPDAHLALAAVAASAELPQRAAAEAQRAMELRPEEERFALLTAQYTQGTQLGNDGARKVLEGFLARRPKATEARFALARLLAADGRTEDARSQMELALRQEPGSPGILFSMAQLAYQLKQPAVAEGYLKRYIELPRSVSRDDTPALLFLAQIAEDGKRYRDAIGWLERVTSGEQRLVALMRRAMLLGKTKRVDEALAVLRGTDAPTARERAQLVSTQAQVLREAGRPNDAFDLLDAALARSPDEPDLLYDHAMAAEKIDRLPTMESSLRKLIGLRPDHAHAYNALGYTFAERNIRLDEAQTLIEKALALAPGDPHIIDSMGWVLYRKGQLESALQWLRKAYDIRPEPDAAAHVGEVLWKLGRTADARAMWQAAHGLDPDNETLKETLARLNVAL